MSEYPEDVMKAATAAYDKDYVPAILKVYSPCANDHRKLAILATARAIIAERERCSDIGYWVCAETRHVTLGDKVRAAINPPSSAASSSVPHPSEQELDRHQHSCSEDGA